MRLLTFNAGLLRLARFVEPTPFLSERLDAMPSAILEIEADVVLLQEVYESEHHARLTAALRHRYPHSFCRTVGGVSRLHDGLMVFGRSPIDCTFVRFRDGPFDERMFASKGFVVVRTTSPEGVPVIVINCHTTAGGVLTLPEHPRVDVARAGQLRQLLRRADAAPDLVTIIGGDLNTGPGVSDSNFRLLESAGWVDLFGALRLDGERPTWDPANPLNLNGPHRTCPPQRIDHFFARSVDIARGTVVPASIEIVLDQPSVFLPDGRCVTPSDHYGVLADLVVRS